MIGGIVGTESVVDDCTQRAVQRFIGLSRPDPTVRARGTREVTPKLTLLALVKYQCPTRRRATSAPRIYTY